MKDKMKIYARPKNCSSLVVKKHSKEIWQAHLTSSDSMKLKNNRELTAKDRKSIISVIKTCTEAMKFLGHANQETNSIKSTNIAMSLPKDLHPLAKDVPIPSERLFGDDINKRINSIKAQQKAFKVDKTYFKPERTFDRKAYFY